MLVFWRIEGVSQHFQLPWLFFHGLQPAWAVFKKKQNLLPLALLIQTSIDRYVHK